MSGWDGEYPHHLHPGLGHMPQDQEPQQMLEPLPGRMWLSPMQGGRGGRILKKKKSPFHSPNNFSAPQNLLRA